jgi:hypothetical protein
MRATSVSVWSRIEKFQARQFSALIEPIVAPPASSEKRIFPIMFCCTTWPTSRPSASLTRTRDLKTLAGRVTASSTVPAMSTTWSLWVMNWS